MFANWYHWIKYYNNVIFASLSLYLDKDVLLMHSCKNVQTPSMLLFQASCANFFFQCTHNFCSFCILLSKLTFMMDESKPCKLGEWSNMF